jgi:hypothetical protein
LCTSAIGHSSGNAQRCLRRGRTGPHLRRSASPQRAPERLCDNTFSVVCDVVDRDRAVPTQTNLFGRPWRRGGSVEGRTRHHRHREGRVNDTVGIVITYAWMTSRRAPAVSTGDRADGPSRSWNAVAANIRGTAPVAARTVRVNVIACARRADVPMMWLVSPGLLRWARVPHDHGDIELVVGDDRRTQPDLTELRGRRDRLLL